MTTAIFVGLWPIQTNEKRLDPATTLSATITLSFVIPRGCDFFDFAQKGLLIDVPTAPTTALALGNGPLLSATLSFLSSRAKPTCPGVPWRDLQFRGPLVEKRTCPQNELSSRPPRRAVGPERTRSGDTCGFLLNPYCPNERSTRFSQNPEIMGHRSVQIRFFKLANLASEGTFR
jgi:hypothetical protein